ncbi:hypothetical protein [Cohnella hashimotonis]|uniref:Tetratricopeptide repeat protein n=1 Tax=Cohnella hashimotonis TaxID=2826895 RepID=A0ABT6TFA7_9BACL|nr:hypothetical protein [Cohnella hashimotonis]MDI4645527.1 hypothetical protein [Cohnella hashimotonis]
MIQPFFSAMNDVLDRMIERYPNSTPDEKLALEEQWNVLKSMSDDIIESWLALEEKMGDYRRRRQAVDIDGLNAESAVLAAPTEWPVPFVKGQGYFKLRMFRECASQFEQLLDQYAEWSLARLYLAMSRMHLGEFAEAHRHFQFVAGTADEPKLQAIAFNAMGCVQAVQANMAQAQHFFRKALELDPGFADAKHNLDACVGDAGSVQLSFGSAELTALAPG